MLDNFTASAAFCLLFILAMTTLGASLAFICRKDMNTSIRAGILAFAAGLMLSAVALGLITPAFLEAQPIHLPYPYWLPGFLGFSTGGLAIWAFGVLIPLCTHHADARDDPHPLDASDADLAPDAGDAGDAGDVAMHHFPETADQPAPLSTNHSTDEHAQDISQPLNDKYSKSVRLFLAVLLHNIPEGIAVGLTLGQAKGKTGETLRDGLWTSVGLAIATGIHNIPEGLAVALPIKEANGIDVARIHVRGTERDLGADIWGGSTVSGGGTAASESLGAGLRGRCDGVRGLR
jgi:zinc transporter ZupT